jgi:hypothetical protein
MDTPSSFISITVVFGEAFKYGDGAKFRDYVGATTRKHCTEFRNSVQSYIFVEYLTSY